MATEKRLIDADALESYLWVLFNFFGSLPCSEADKATQRGIKRCIGEVKKMPTVDAVEVVHSRFVNVADFGDGEGCFGYCEKCGTVHHAQSPVALKADHRWCRWCGAKMDGDGNG